jgi:cell division cycle protein 37
MSNKLGEEVSGHSFRGCSFLDLTDCRIADRNHKAHSVFNDDVNTTHTRIRTRTKEILTERGLGDSPGGVEQIQLQAVDPDTAIHINVPPPDSEDPEVQEARKIFEAFPPGLQRALERGALEDINVVLGKMAVDEAEEVVELLGQGGMLSIEPKIIDTTKGETIPERPSTQHPKLDEVREEELD